MKVLRWGPSGSEKPAVLDHDGSMRDLSSRVRDIDSNFLQELMNKGSDRLREEWRISEQPILPKGTRTGPPVANIPELLCVGLNYMDHAEEAGVRTLPREPIIFSKPHNTVVGPNDTITIPYGSKKTDWEVELGVVIGKTCKCVTHEQAADVIAGYTIVHDISERNYQLERGGGQWFKGKCCDGFCPIGPFLVTADEVGNPHSLDLWLEVDGVCMQKSNTRYMIFDCYDIVSHLSQYMTLTVGTIIATGTPGGVGMGRRPPRYLQPGNVVRLGITGLGEQQQEFIREESRSRL